MSILLFLLSEFPKAFLFSSLWKVESQGSLKFSPNIFCMRKSTLWITFRGVPLCIWCCYGVFCAWEILRILIIYFGIASSCNWSRTGFWITLGFLCYNRDCWFMSEEVMLFLPFEEKGEVLWQACFWFERNRRIFRGRLVLGCSVGYYEMQYFFIYGWWCHRVEVLGVWHVACKDFCNY